MKAFEEWLKTIESDYFYTCSKEYLAERAWKAALEWALTQRASGIEEDGSISTSSIIFDRDIREELEE